MQMYFDQCMIVLTERIVHVFPAPLIFLFKISPHRLQNVHYYHLCRILSYHPGNKATVTSEDKKIFIYSFNYLLFFKYWLIYLFV